MKCKLLSCVIFLTLMSSFVAKATTTETTEDLCTQSTLSNYMVQLEAIAYKEHSPEARQALMKKFETTLDEAFTKLGLDKNAQPKFDLKQGTTDPRYCQAMKETMAKLK